MEALPDPVLHAAFSLVDPQALLALRRVCRRFRRLANDASLKFTFAALCPLPRPQLCDWFRGRVEVARVETVDHATAVALCFPHAREVGLYCLEEAGDLTAAAAAAVPNLHTVDVSASQITDEGVRALSSCGTIQVVEMGECRLLTDAAVVFLAPCPLRIANFSRVSLGISACTALAFKESLREADFRGCVGVTDTAVACLATCPLQRLRLSFCIRLTDVAACHVSTCDTLRWTEFAGCRQMTDAAVLVLGRLPKLETVDFEGCPLVARGPLAALEAACALRAQNAGD